MADTPDGTDDGRGSKATKTKDIVIQVEEAEAETNKRKTRFADEEVTKDDGDGEKAEAKKQKVSEITRFIEYFSNIYEELIQSVMDTQYFQLLICYKPVYSI